MSGAANTASWALSDITMLAAQNPYTFYKPSDDLLRLLEPGDLVKLIFEILDSAPDGFSGERMWVKITQRSDDSFTGLLDNQPTEISDLEPGSIINFTTKHIAAADRPDPVPDPTLKWHMRCFVTNRVLQDGAEVGFFYREAPDNDRDSGWRFIAGDEDQSYMDDPQNSQLVSLGAVLRCDDRMADLLDREAPVAFEWDDSASRFIEVDMPEDPD